MKKINKKNNEKSTSYKRVMVALKGGKPDRVPVMPFVRDWATKQCGFTVEDTMNNVEKYVFSQYYCARSFGYDAVQDLGGVHAESEAMGSKLKIHKNESPSIVDYAIKDYDKDLKKLKILNPYKDGRLPIILEQIKRLKELCKGDIVIDSYLQAPFRHAAMLRGNDIYRDIIKKREKVKELLEITLYSQIIYGTALVHAGADVISISDPTSSGDIISRKQWLELGFIYTKKLVKELKKTGVKIYLHICGDTSDRLDTFMDLGIDGMSLDQKVDLEYARKVMGKKFPLIGNVSPTNLMYSTPDEVAEESKICIEKAGKKGSFILTSGCGIGMDAPVENIQAMVDTARNYYY